MKAPVSLVWFRQDLRLADNPALNAAIERGLPIVPVFIWAPEEEEAWAPGGASRWWLHQSLRNLDESLRKRGSRLTLRRGGSLRELETLAKSAGADALFYNRRYEPAALRRDAEVNEGLTRTGMRVSSFNNSLLFDPEEICDRSACPFKVFTRFWSACLQLPEPSEPLDFPFTLPNPAKWPQSLPLKELALEPVPDWAGGIREVWQPGEENAAATLARFLDEALEDYAVERDRPDHDGTSRLSPYLHFGEISPGQVWHAVQRRVRGGSPSMEESAVAFLRQLGWREFGHHLLVHFPETPEHALRPSFESFPWSVDPLMLKAWQRGETGYPMVDAGMRALWHTGWLHNRVRLVVASFLVKDLLQSWREGEAWFWDTLLDVDLADNTLGWQWVAGSGADAAPYFRIFNPVVQGERFDPQGDYVRRWLPELAKLPAQWIQKPWEAHPALLAEAGIELGRTYPYPIIEHSFARARTLAAFDEVKTRKAVGV